MLTKSIRTVLASALTCLFQHASAATLPPITLAWNPIPDSDIAVYEVKYGTVSGTYGTTVSAGPNNSKSIYGLTEGVTYYFVVVGYTKDGLRSDPSDPISYPGTNPEPNQAPLSTISTPSSNTSITVGQSISFSGNANDPDGNTPLSYLWNFGSGSGISDFSSLNPGSRQFNNAGTFEVTFTASDSLGLADPTPATRTITVTPPILVNQAPDSTISAPSSNVSITEGEVVYFAGSGSDPNDNTPLTYLWSFGSGSGIADSSEQNPGTRIFKNAGSYVVTFTATDSLGLADQTPATRTVTVTAPVANQAPDSTIFSPSSDLTITAGQSADFSGIGNDPDSNTALTYFWNFGNGSGIEDSTAQNPGSQQFDNPGTYEVIFTATDSLGLADPTPATRTVTVSPPVVVNQAPQSTISVPSSDVDITVGQSISFSGSGSDPDSNTPFTYLWDFGDESGIGESTEQSPGSRQFDNPGTYEVTFTATDSLGLADPTPATRTITVTPPVVVSPAPESAISRPSSDANITVGQYLSFSGRGSDPDDNTPFTYLWNFGDDSGIEDSTSRRPRWQQFNTPGTFVVSFTVTNSLGLADPTPATRTITVAPLEVANQAPQSTILTPATNVGITVGQSVDFSGSGSDPDSNATLTYSWVLTSTSGTTSSTDQNPGLVPFDTAGTYEVSLTVTDSEGLADPTPATRTITVNPPAVSNQAPQSTISIPSSDVEITVGATLSFSGSGSDPDGNTPLSYLWNFGNNSGFADSTSQNPGNRRFNTAGTYEVTLTVSDSLGLADPTPAIRIITVSPPNQAPESTISEPSNDITIAEGGVVYFAGSGSDPDGNTPLTYGWNFGSGSSIDDAIVQNPGTRIFKNAGTYLVTFTAFDSLGLPDQTPATRTITVLTPNQAPDSTISSPSSDVTITAGQSVDFSGSGLDPDGDGALAYLWSFSSGSGITNSTSQNPGATQFDIPGTYEVSLIVTDANGLADPTPAMRIVTVLAPPPGVNQAPNSTITEPSSDITIAEGQSVTFAGNGDDPDGDTPLTYSWNLTSRSGRSDSTSQNPGAVRFWRRGTYEISLTVTDAEGMADPTPATRTITVTDRDANQPPISTITAPSSDINIITGESVLFAGNGDDPDGDTPLTYRWDLTSDSGSSSSTIQNPGQVKFESPGTFQVTLIVTDSEGLSDPSPATRTVTVTDPITDPGSNKAPDSIVSEPAEDLTITAGEFVIFSGTGEDPDGDTQLSYLWDFGSGSGIANSTTQIPGARQFDIPGTHEVSLTVTDAKGLADPTPAMLTITVIEAPESIPGLEGWITSPESNVTISEGESVWFTGYGINNYNWGSMSYRWNFGAGSDIPDSTQKRPKAQRFNNPGTYKVTLTVINSNGVADPSPASVTIVVTEDDPD